MWFYGFIVSSSDDPFYIYTLVHVPPPTYLRPPLVFAQMGHHCQLGDFWKKGHRQKRFKFLAFKRAGPGPWSIFASLNLSRLNVAYIWIYMPQTAVIGTIWTRGTKKTYSVNMLLYSTTIKCRNTRSIYSVTLLRLSTKLHKIRSLALNKWPSCQAISFKRNHSHESIEIYTCFYCLLYWLNTKRLHLALKHTHSPSKSCRSLP